VGYHQDRGFKTMISFQAFEPVESEIVGIALVLFILMLTHLQRVLKSFRVEASEGGASEHALDTLLKSMDGVYTASGLRHTRGLSSVKLSSMLKRGTSGLVYGSRSSQDLKAVSGRAAGSSPESLHSGSLPTSPGVRRRNSLTRAPAPLASSGAGGGGSLSSNQASPLDQVASGGGGEGAGGFSPEAGAEELRRQETQWRLVPPAYQDATITCFHEPAGGSCHRFKYEVLIESEPAPVVAIARELDLMPSWHKFVSKSAIVEKLPADVTQGGSSFGGIWGYVELWFPWPLSNRAMVVKCEVVDVLQETGSILVRLLSGDYDEAKLPTTSDECPRLVAQNLTQIVPLPPCPRTGKPRTKFVLFVDTDFMTPLIPGFVIQFILKVMAPVVYSKVKELLESEFGGDTLFQKRMAETPEMYAALTERVHAYLKTKPTGNGERNDTGQGGNELLDPGNGGLGSCILRPGTPDDLFTIFGAKEEEDAAPASRVSRPAPTFSKGPAPAASPLRARQPAPTHARVERSLGETVGVQVVSQKRAFELERSLDIRRGLSDQLGVGGGGGGQSGASRSASFLCSPLCAPFPLRDDSPPPPSRQARRKPVVKRTQSAASIRLVVGAQPRHGFKPQAPE